MAFSNPRLRAALLLLLCFVAGLVVGVVGDHLVLLHARRLMPPHGRMLVHRIGDRLDRELGLSDVQRRQVDVILERHQKEIDALMRAVQPRVRQELSRANGEIETILTAEQKQKFIALRARWHRRAEQFMK